MAEGLKEEDESLFAEEDASLFGEEDTGESGMSTQEISSTFGSSLCFGDDDWIMKNKPKFKPIDFDVESTLSPDPTSVDTSLPTVPPLLTSSPIERESSSNLLAKELKEIRASDFSWVDQYEEPEAGSDITAAIDPSEVTEKVTTLQTTLSPKDAVAINTPALLSAMQRNFFNKLGPRLTSDSASGSVAGTPIRKSREDSADAFGDPDLELTPDEPTDSKHWIDPTKTNKNSTWRDKETLGQISTNYLFTSRAILTDEMITSSRHNSRRVHRTVLLDGADEDPSNSLFSDEPVPTVPKRWEEMMEEQKEEEEESEDEADNVGGGTAGAHTHWVDAAQYTSIRTRLTKFLIGLHTELKGDDDINMSDLADRVKSMLQAYKEKILRTKGNKLSAAVIREGLEDWICSHPIIEELSRQCKTIRHKDHQLQESLQLHRFVQGEHLDIKTHTTNDMQMVFNMAGADLVRMNQFKTPRGKILCINSACQGIFNALNLVRDTADSGARVGADDFLPILVFVILRTRVPNLVWNLEFLGHFRDSEQLSCTKEGYLYASMTAATEFLRTLNMGKLTITPQEYASIIARALSDKEAAKIDSDATLFTADPRTIHGDDKLEPSAESTAGTPPTDIDTITNDANTPTNIANEANKTPPVPPSLPTKPTPKTAPLPPPLPKLTFTRKALPSELPARVPTPKKKAPLPPRVSTPKALRPPVPSPPVQEKSTAP